MPIPEHIRKGMAAGSWIRKMFETGLILKKQFGEENVFDLSLGNPVIEPPPELKLELRKLAETPVKGMHRYMENAGYLETRNAISEQITKDTGVTFGAKDIIMTVGAAGALNVILRTILNRGDEVIIFAPYFAEYVHYIAHHNGEAKIMPTDARFVPDLDALEAGIGSKTKAVFINSPNNPSGAVYDETFIHRLGEVLEKKSKQLGTQIYLISDEAYSRIIFDGKKYPAIWKHYRQSMVATSHSKDLALPGERIGYIAVHPEMDGGEELINGLIYCNRTLGFVNAPALMQRVVARLQGVIVDVNIYQRKRDFLYQNLIEMGYSLVKPQGAFYMFPKTPTADDVAFVRELQQERVLTVPGSGFGSPGHIRLSYCLEDSTIEGSLAGLRKIARKYKLS